MNQNPLKVNNRSATHYIASIKKVHLNRNILAIQIAKLKD